MKHLPSDSICTSLPICDHGWAPVEGQLGCCRTESLLPLADAASLGGSDFAGGGFAGRGVLLSLACPFLESACSSLFSDFCGDPSNLALGPC